MITPTIGQTYVVRPLRRANRMVALAYDSATDRVSGINLDNNRPINVKRSLLKRDSLADMSANSSTLPRSRN